MLTYIALLRGINVGGHRKILMTDLKQLLNKNGLKNINTYIQSGNVVFSSGLPAKEIESVIKQAIFKKYGFEVPALVKTAEEIAIIFNGNPFLSQEMDIKRLYVAFLSEKPTTENLERLKTIEFEDAKFKVIRQHLYICYDTKVSNSKLSNNLIENKLKVTATSRNWKTVTKLYELSNA